MLESLFDNIKEYSWFKNSLEVRIRIGHILYYARLLEAENKKLKEQLKNNEVS